MWKLAATGCSLLVAGAVQFTAFLNHTPTLEDYLAFRCGPSAQAAISDAAGRTLIGFAHCWGCYAMAIGVGLLLLAAVQAMARSREEAWRRS